MTEQTLSNGSEGECQHDRGRAHMPTAMGLTEVGKHDAIDAARLVATTDGTELVADHTSSHNANERQPHCGVDHGSSLQLLDLPTENLLHIFSYFDVRPPSQMKCLERPAKSLTVSIHRPLKDVSVLSKRLRSITLKLLFRHTRLDPYNLSSFLDFVASTAMSNAIESLTATLQGRCSHIHPIWWARLLNEIPLTTLTVHAAPHVFSELVATGVDASHAWAFEMPYHTLTLTQSLEVARRPISYGSLPDFLTSRPWHSLRFNEGSSLQAYATYEYFLKRTPSLLASLYLNQSTAGSELFSTLESFEFIAIFPFFNHVDEILKCVRQMKRLRRLFIKLCPEPDSTVFHDEIEATRGHIDVNDPWNEFDTAYHLVTHSVRYLVLEGQLDLFIVDDVKMAGIRESLETSLNLRLGDLHEFRMEQSGIWRRKQSGQVSSRR